MTEPKRRQCNQSPIIRHSRIKDPHRDSDALYKVQAAGAVAYVCPQHAKEIMRVFFGSSDPVAVRVSMLRGKQLFEEAPSE